MMSQNKEETAYFEASFDDDSGFVATLDDRDDFEAESSDAVEIRYKNYGDLTGKPFINGVELSPGNHTLEELGEDTISNESIKSIVDAQFSTIFGG